MQEATSARDWTRALALAEQINEAIEPQHVEALYTIARLQALLGHTKEAYEWLQRVADAGLMNVWEVRRDEAFAALRDEDQFKELTRAIWLKAYIHLLERRERDAYQKPEQVIQALAFRPGERVAESVPARLLHGPGGACRRAERGRLGGRHRPGAARLPRPPRERGRALQRPAGEGRARRPAAAARGRRYDSHGGHPPLHQEP